MCAAGESTHIVWALGNGIHIVCPGVKALIFTLCLPRGNITDIMCAAGKGLSYYVWPLVKELILRTGTKCCDIVSALG